MSQFPQERAVKKKGGAEICHCLPSKPFFLAGGKVACLQSQSETEMPFCTNRATKNMNRTLHYEQNPLCFQKMQASIFIFFCVSICQFIYNLLFSTDLCFHCTIKINCLVTSPPTVTFVIIILFLNLQTSSLSPCLPLHLSDFTLPPFSKTLEDNHLLPLPIRVQWQISELLDLFFNFFF